MYSGTVTGNVVATRKDESLVGSKLLIIQLDEGMSATEKTIIAVDTVGAGKNDRVLVCTGSPARLAIKNSSAPVDAAVVGIIDNINS